VIKFEFGLHLTFFNLRNTGILDTAKYVYNKYGIVRGFYRGISLNYIRAVPMVATSFCIYEISKKYLGLDTGVKVLS
jgi:solute carrier family 25 protein 16